jgi:iron complex transport system ATP-binding protein
MEPILRLKNIGFKYNEKQVLKDISLDVNAGEILGILGPNGSGKSTLLRVMDGVLSPEGGEIEVNGKPYRRLKRNALAREVAMVAQEQHFRFSFSCIEVVLMGRFPHLKRLQFEDHHDLKIATESLKATHALEFAERSIHDLSGGEKQRVLIARALAQEPKVILLDEPTSFLDLKFKREVFKLIASLSKEKGLGVSIVSHDIDLVAQYCSKIILLKNGTVYRTGDPDSVITAENIEDVYECPVLVDQNPLSGKPRVSVR